MSGDIPGLFPDIGGGGTDRAILHSVAIMRKLYKLENTFPSWARPHMVLQNLTVSRILHRMWQHFTQCLTKVLQFVGNLPKDCTEDHLTELFAKYGKVTILQKNVQDWVYTRA